MLLLSCWYGCRTFFLWGLLVQALPTACGVVAHLRAACGWLAAQRHRPLPHAPQVTDLRPGRYYAVRMWCTATATAAGQPPATFAPQTSQLQVFRTLPTPPGAMQPPSLAQRARNALKVGCGEGARWRVRLPQARCSLRCQRDHTEVPTATS